MGCGEYCSMLWVTCSYPYMVKTSKDRVKFVSICFCMGESLFSRVIMHFQVRSNSAYPQHTGERYRTIGPLVNRFHPI